MTKPRRSRRPVPAEAWAPGTYIQEELQERGWTEDDFARMIGWSRETLDALLSSNPERITREQATDIARGFGTSGQFWLNLEELYRRWLSSRRFDGVPGYALVSEQDAQNRRAALAESQPRTGGSADGA